MIQNACKFQKCTLRNSNSDGKNLEFIRSEKTTNLENNIGPFNKPSSVAFVELAISGLQR